MRMLLATLRRRPGPLVGTLVALSVAALVVTLMASFVGTASVKVPAQRLAATAVVVTGDANVSFTSGSGQGATTEVLALPAYRRVPAALASKLAALPGVAAAVADVSVPLALELPDGKVATGTSAAPITGYGWQSAILTPFALRAGQPPVGSRQLVMGAGLAKATRLSTGDKVRLAGQDLPPFTVAGVAAAPAHDSAQDWTVFFSTAEATALYSHTGQADLIGIVARSGTSPSLLAARVRKSVASEGLSVLTGANRGEAENLAATSELSNLSALGAGAGIDIVLITLFVAAGAVALSVAERRRMFALLRAVGATPGQVRRMVMVELAALGILAGLIGYLPGVFLASWAVRGLGAHQFIPASVHAWTSPWELLLAVGVGTVIAQVAGLLAARRASRIPPAAALQEASVERRYPRPVRLVLGLAALAGGVVLCVVTFGQSSAAQQLSLALLMLLAFMVAVALLGPFLVVVAELALRLPLRLAARLPGRLASAEVRGRPRRMASAVVSVALAVTFVGAIYLIDATQTQASIVQGRQRLVASEVVSTPGPGLAPDVLAAIGATPGVTAAVGLTPTIVFIGFDHGNGAENASAEAVTPGQLSAVLDLKVVVGTLVHFRPGDIALSDLVAGTGAIDTHVGQTITTYLADGTPYRAKVTAIFARSLGFGDVLVPAAANGGGHLGSISLGEVLVHGSRTVSPANLSSELTSLANRYPGLHVASRSVVNAQYELLTAQTSYVNNLLLGLIALLAAVTLANTLVVATLERRESLLLLRRVGATSRQLLSMTTWQTILLNVIGVILGTGAAAAAVAVPTKALTGSYLPYLTWPPAVLIVSLVLVLSAISTLGPTAAILGADHHAGQN